MRPRIKWEMEVEEVLNVMAEGDPLALQALTEILTKNQQGPQIILDMDDMNIRGAQIVTGVQDVCKGDLKMFVRMVFNRNPILVDEINKEHSKHKAVTHGASMEVDR